MSRLPKRCSRVLLPTSLVAASLLAAARVEAGGHPLLCNLTFVEQTDAAFRQLSHLKFKMHYPPAQLSFGTGAVPCEVHPLQTGVSGTFTIEHEAETDALEVQLERDNGLFPYPLASCEPNGSEDWESAVLSIELIEARNKEGQDLDPAPEIAIDTFDCVAPPTTTTTTTTPPTTTTTVEQTTTTTVSGEGTCGDADGNGSISASDALLALRAAVGSAQCAPARCDTNADASLNASDALRILHAAVGLPEPLTCP